MHDDVMDKLVEILEEMKYLQSKVDFLYNLANAQSAEVCFFCGDQSAHEIECDGRILGLCDEHDSDSWHQPEG